MDLVQKYKNIYELLEDYENIPNCDIQTDRCHELIILPKTGMKYEYYLDRSILLEEEFEDIYGTYRNNYGGYINGIYKKYNDETKKLIQRQNILCEKYKISWKIALTFKIKSLKSEVFVINGKKEGECIRYDLIGRIFEKLNFVNDKLHGDNYFYSGKKKNHKTFNMGKLLKDIQYNDDGSIGFIANYEIYNIK